MEWSLERPNKPGWYWVRLCESTVIGTEPRLGLVGHNGWCWTPNDGLRETGAFLITKTGALYAGPIEPPPLPEGTK